MAIKVIGEDTTKIKRTTCSNCSAILEYTLADTTIQTERDYTGCADTYRRLKCPRCNNKITVSMY